MRQIGLCARREAITLRMIAATPVSVAFGFGRVRVRHDKGNAIAGKAKAIASPLPGLVCRAARCATKAKHQTKYVQNFCARSVVFHVGGAGLALATKK